MNSHLLPVLALLISATAFFAYVNPSWTGSIAETKARIADNNQALDAARDYTMRQNELATAKNAIEPESLSRLSAFLPDSVDNVGIILDLNALATRSGLSLANIDVSKESIADGDSSADQSLQSSKMNPVGSIDLSLSASGTYAALQVFLSGIERSVRLLDVREITVKGSDTGIYEYKMILRIYWLR